MGDDLAAIFQWFESLDNKHNGSTSTNSTTQALLATLRRPRVGERGVL